MDIASACLTGRKCRYDGESREDPEIKKLYDEGRIKAVCPECLAGLKVPRCPSEITGGDGRDVLRAAPRHMVLSSFKRRQATIMNRRTKWSGQNRRTDGKPKIFLLAK